MRPSLAPALAILICLVGVGFRPDGLPFMPSAAYSDAAIAHYPAALTVYRQGIQTAWTELNMAGQPFAANPLNKTAYPPQLLSTLVAPPLSLNILAVLHIVLAAAGMWYWARRLGLSEWPAAVAATAYAVSPRLIAHLAAGHLDLVYALAWFPLLMAGVHALANRATAAASIGTAWVGAMIVLADVRLSVFAFASAGFYGLALAIQRRQWRWLLAGGSALVLLFVLTVGVTLPLSLWQPYLNRGSLTASEAGAFSLEPAMLLGAWLAPPAADPEMQTFVGIVTLLLAVTALLTQPRRLSFWAVLIVLATLYALGSGGFLWTLPVEIFPPLRWFRVPARAWFIVALTMPLLAGYGTQTILDGLPHLPRRSLGALVVGIGAFICGAFILLSIPSLAESALRILTFGVGIALVIGFVGRNGIPPRYAAVLLFTLMLADLGWNARSWLEWQGRATWLTPYVPLAEILQSDAADRIYSPTYSVQQQVAAEYELLLFGGVDPFQLRGVADAIETASGVGHHGYTVTQPPLIGGEGDDLRTANQDAIPDTDLLAEWQVSHVVSAYPLQDSRMALVAQIDGVYVYRNLEYASSIPRDEIPRWAAQQNLPDAATVLRINQLTILAQTVGTGLMLVTPFAVYLLGGRRRINS